MLTLPVDEQVMVSSSEQVVSVVVGEKHCKVRVFMDYLYKYWMQCLSIARFFSVCIFTADSLSWSHQVIIMTELVAKGSGTFVVAISSERPCNRLRCQ
jgi:hypothetical protein